jgi:hypothetical protein
VPKKRWQDLSPRARIAIVIGAVVDAVLKAFALQDLRKRPAAEIRGPKPLWAVVVAVSNSAGVVPLIYLVFGRRKAPELTE